MAEFALINCEIYTGDSVRSDASVHIKDEWIVSVCSDAEIPAEVPRLDLAGLSVAPGFVDLQVNGGGDVLFNDEPTVEGIRRIRDAHRRLGTTDIVPTFITGPSDGMRSALDAVRSVVSAGESGVLGLHFEGPAINAAKAGVHDASFIGPGRAAELLALVSSDESVRVLVTLAPELVDPTIIEEFVRRGVRIAAGHTNASSAEIERAVASGVALGTHVWNAMSPMTSRDPGAVGSLLFDDRVYCDFIADGFHVDFRTLAVSLRAKPSGKAFLVTDAMSPVGGTRGGYTLGPYEVTVVDGKCVTQEGSLAGSALDLATAVRNCVQQCAVPKNEALRMASTYPAAFFGRGSDLGRIAPGFRAHLVVFDTEVNVQGVVIDGEYSRS